MLSLENYLLRLFRLLVGAPVRLHEDEFFARLKKVVSLADETDRFFMNFLRESFGFGDVAWDLRKKRRGRLTSWPPMIPGK